MKIKLVFENWVSYSKDIDGEKQIELTSGNFHSGSTFPAEIELEEEDAQEVLAAMTDGYHPTFMVVKDQ